MSIGAFIVMFSVSWWIILYIVLPIGNKVENVELGHADSAPSNPRVGIKLFFTTIAALIITMIFLYLVEIKVIDLIGYFTGYNKKLFNF